MRWVNMLFWGSGNWLRGVAALVLFFANAVVRAEAPLPATDQTKPNQVGHPEGADSQGVKAATAVSISDAVARRRREAIALMLEANEVYGIALQVPPKTANAKFAGPFEYKGLFQTKPSTIYCASARIDFPFLAGEYVAVMAIVPTPDGKEKIVGRILTADVKANSIEGDRGGSGHCGEVSVELVSDLRL